MRWPHEGPGEGASARRPLPLQEAAGSGTGGPQEPPGGVGAWGPYMRDEHAGPSTHGHKGGSKGPALAHGRANSLDPGD